MPPGNEHGGRRRGWGATVAVALAWSIALFVVCLAGLVASLGYCRAENVPAGSACPPVDDHPGAAFVLAVVAPAVGLLALGVARTPRRLVHVVAAFFTAGWVAYVIAVATS